MTAPAHFAWTAEHAAYLRRRRAEGAPYSEIAKEIGVSHSAQISEAHPLTQACRHGCYTPADLALARRMREDGASWTEIATALRRPRKSLIRVLRRLEVKVSSPRPKRLKRKPEDELVRQVLADGGFPQIDDSVRPKRLVWPARMAA